MVEVQGVWRCRRKTKLIDIYVSRSRDGEQVKRCTRSNSNQSKLGISGDCARLSHSVDQTRSTCIENWTCWQMPACIDLQKRTCVCSEIGSHWKRNTARTTLHHCQLVRLSSWASKASYIVGRDCTYCRRDSIEDDRSITCDMACSVDTDIHVEDRTSSKPSTHRHCDQRTWRDSWKTWNLDSLGIRMFVYQIIVVDSRSPRVDCSLLKSKHVRTDL